MEKKSTGEIIAEYRKAKGMTQRSLAEQLNITDKAVSKWERNIARPDISLIPKLSAILEIPVEYLLDLPLPVTQETKQTAADLTDAEDEYQAPVFDEQEELRTYHMLLFRQLALKGLLGFTGGFLFALMVTLSDKNTFSVLFGCAIGFFCAGIPYGYELLGKIIGQWYVVGHIAVMLIVFILKFVGAAFIGWIAYPIALLYNLVKALKRDSKLRKVIIILLCLVVIVTILFWGWQLVGAFNNDANSGEASSNYSYVAEVPDVIMTGGAKGEWITTVDEINNSATYQVVFEDALNRTILEEQEDSDSGYEITSHSVLQTAYFLTVKDSSEEHWDYGDDVKMKNAIIVVSSYGINIMNTVTRNEYFTWVYPNWTVSETHEVEYDSNLVHEDYLTADGVDDVYGWLCEEYSDMDIYPLTIIQ